MFAQSVADDYSLPQSSVLTITKAIQEQLSDFKAHTIESVDDDGFFGAAPARSADNDIWWERWRNGLRTENGAVRRKKRKSSSGSGPSDPTTSYIKFESGGRPTTEQNQDDDSTEEMRILIKVSVLVSWRRCSTHVSASSPCHVCSFLTSGISVISWISLLGRSDLKISLNGTCRIRTGALRSVSRKYTVWSLA